MRTMRREEALSEGWYYRQAGQTFGPVSADQLRDFLGQGRLPPRQAVCRQGSHTLLFVHAAKAAGGTEGECAQPPFVEPVSA
jgi:hypothetical protein